MLQRSCSQTTVHTSVIGLCSDTDLSPNFVALLKSLTSRNISVGLHAEWPGFDIRHEYGCFLLPLLPKLLSSPHLVPYPEGAGGYFPRLNWPKREADDSSRSRMRSPYV